MAKLIKADRFLKKASLQLWMSKEISYWYQVYVWNQIINMFISSVKISILE